MSRQKAQGGLSPDALFDTSEGEALEGPSGGTEVLGGLVAEEAALIVESGRHAGERVVLGAGTCVIGRSSKCALVLRRSAGVSRRHSKIIYVGGTYELSDCGSRNGTRVNGLKVGVGFPLNDGDVIQISDERVRFRGPSGRAGAEDTRGLLVDVEPLVQQLPSREQPAGEVLRTQRVRVESPDSLLMTKDGGTAPGRPVPPRMNPPPVVMPPETLAPTAARREPPKGALFALGILLGLTILIGGVAGWDLLLNDGRVTSALEQDVTRLFAGDDTPAPKGAVATSEPPKDAVATSEPPKDAVATSAPPKSESVVAVKAGVAGRVRSVAVTAGDVVRAGDTLVVVERALSGRAARKLQSLRREEQAFVQHAASGDARAKRDLEDVRREIARLERRAGNTRVKADVGGRVADVEVGVGARVEADVVVARVAAEGP